MGESGQRAWAIVVVAGEGKKMRRYRVCARVDSNAMRSALVVVISMVFVSGCASPGATPNARDARKAKQAGLILLCGQGRLGESGRYLCCTFYNPSDEPLTFGWWNQIDYSIIRLVSDQGIVWSPMPMEFGKHTMGAHTLKRGESRAFLVDLGDGKFSRDFEAANFTVEYTYPREMGYDLRKKQGWVLHATSAPFEIERWRVHYRERGERLRSGK